MCFTGVGFFQEVLGLHYRVFRDYDSCTEGFRMSLKEGLGFRVFGFLSTVFRFQLLETRLEGLKFVVVGCLDLVPQYPTFKFFGFL